MKIEYLLTMDIRYNDAPKFENDTIYKSKVITLGVFNSYEDAADNGNKALKYLETQFALNKNWNKRERFSKNGGLLGYPVKLIGDLGYLNTPFRFYCKITELKYYHLGESVSEAIEAVKRHVKFHDQNK